MELNCGQKQNLIVSEKSLWYQGDSNPSFVSESSVAFIIGNQCVKSGGYIIDFICMLKDLQNQVTDEGQAL